MSYQDVRHHYEDQPDEEDLKRADRQRALKTHREHECNEEVCWICEGRLFLCTICGGAEGTLPYECPGVRMTQAQATDVISLRKDFVGGEWRVPTIPTA